jgi:hypothetical protein
VPQRLLCGSPRWKMPREHMESEHSCLHSRGGGLGTPHGCGPAWTNTQDTVMSRGSVHIWGSALLQLTMQWLNEEKTIN